MKNIVTIRLCPRGSIALNSSNVCTMNITASKQTASTPELAVTRPVNSLLAKAVDQIVFDAILHPKKTISAQALLIKLYQKIAVKTPVDSPNAQATGPARGILLEKISSEDVVTLRLDLLPQLQHYLSSPELIYDATLLATEIPSITYLKTSNPDLLEQLRICIQTKFDSLERYFNLEENTDLGQLRNPSNNVMLFLQHLGIDFNRQNNMQSPIYFATRNQYYQLLKQLLKYGVDPNMPKVRASLALSSAIFNKNLQAAHILLNAGATPTDKILYWAITNAAQPDLLSDNNSRFISLLLQHNQDPNREFVHTRLSVLVAINNGKFATTTLLLVHGAQAKSLELLFTIIKQFAPLQETINVRTMSEEVKNNLLRQTTNKIITLTKLLLAKDADQLIVNADGKSAAILPLETNFTELQNVLKAQVKIINFLEFDTKKSKAVQ